MAAWEIALVLGLVVVLLVLFVREVFPVSVTALLGAAVLTLTGILTPEEGLAGFSSEATVSILALFIISAGVQRTGAVDALIGRLLRWSGSGHRRQLATLGLTVGPLSGFVNNTPLVAVMIPGAYRMAAEGGRSPSKLLFPISIFAMLGGLLTLIGTSTNILGNALLPSYGVEPFRFFDFAPIGIVALAVGIMYFVTIGASLLPDRGRGNSVERFDLKGFLGEFVVPDGSPTVGQSLQDAGLVWTAGVQAVRVTRETRRHDAPVPHFTLRAGDELMLEGSREQLARIVADKGLVAAPDVQSRPDEDEMWTAELVIIPGSPLVGRPLAAADVAGRYEAVVLAVRHHERVVIGPLSHSRLAAGDVLLVRASPLQLERMRESADFVLKTLA